jgi:hypothetical protein
MASFFSPLDSSQIPIRTQPQYSESEVESEVESGVELLESEQDEDNQSIAERLSQNMEYLEEQLPSWTLRPMADGITLVQKPIQVLHRALHPAVYRNVKSPITLDQLAQLLGSGENWLDLYNDNIDGNSVIMNTLNMFQSLPDETPESEIQAIFMMIVTLIGGRLGLTLYAANGRKTIVGGFLAKHELDVRSATDPCFLKNGRYVLATEIKTAKTFTDGTYWYYTSRGVQVLSALYAFNCPTFLLNQKVWKLFVENQERTKVMTFPVGNDPQGNDLSRASKVYGIGTTLLKAITICLLSKRSGTLMTMAQSVPVPTPRFKDTRVVHSEKKPKRARQDPGSEFPFTPPPPPAFKSGYENGQAVYTYIRVMPQDQVDMLGEEIQAEEKIQMASRQESASTLVERD